MSLNNTIIPIIDVYITGQCNFKCQYCFGEEDSRGHISLETYKKILNFADYIGAKISLTGGEPLLHPFIDKIVLNSKNKNIPLLLRTNGMLLNKYMYLCDSFEWIGISLDGIEEINNIMRPTSNSFKYTSSQKIKIPLDSIKKIKNKCPDVKILIATIATAKNIDYIVHLAELLNNKKLSIDLWKIYQFTSNNFRSLLTKNKFEITYKHLNNLENLIREKVDFDILFKYGEGNCLLVDIKGNLIINGIIIGSVYEDFVILSKKIRESKKFQFLILNKHATYGTS